MNWIKRYYYLVPVWFLLETFLWQGFRAAPVVGDSPAGTAAFYALEGAIGYGLWTGHPAAPIAAILENAGQLLMTLRHIVITPLDIAAAIDKPEAQPLAENYARSVPGAIISGFHLVLMLHWRLKR